MMNLRSPTTLDVLNTIYLYIYLLITLVVYDAHQTNVLDLKVSATITAILTLFVIVFAYPVINVIPIAGKDDGALFE